MEYFITFLEGLVTFISPCLLPMLPIYLSYLAGGSVSENRTGTFRNAVGFVLGFSATFIVLGALAGTLGAALQRHQTAVNLVTGLIVVVFGLSFLGVIPLNFLRGFRARGNSRTGFVPSIVFGMVFSVGWTPCVGAFLGSALMLASQQGSTAKGVLLLLCYSLGLGVPFLLSALLLDQLQGAFNWVKRHYRVINIVCGCLLIAVGVAMMTGMLGALLGALAA